VSDPLYRREILRLAADAHGAGRLDAPDAKGAAANPTCGDRVTADVKLMGERIVALALESKACVLAQASASILGAELVGKTKSDVEMLREALALMLNGGSGAPLPDYEAFAGVTAHAGRHKCVLLPVDAVLDAFASSERTEPTGEGTER